MISKKDFIKSIIAIKQENGISAFVGAGLCSDAKMPDWLHLLKPCAKELNINLDENTDLFKFAQYYANKFGYNRLRKLVNKTLNTYQHDSELVSSILNVGFKSIWTTNYDKIIENNIVKLDALSNTIFDEKDLVNVSLLNRINIFKLNGDISNLDNIVITQNDIDTYPKKHALFLTFLKRELVTNTFIFIGYSFNDKIVLSALAEINSYLGESCNTHYTIMKDKHTDEFYMFIDDLEKRYHIKTVLVEEYDEIPLLLYELKSRILDKNIFISGSFEYLPQSEDDFAYRLCKALGEKLIENNYNIVTGFGRNIGYYISGTVTQKLINNNIANIEERLIMRPFAHIMTADEDNQFRRLLIGNASTSIFMFGQHLNNQKPEISRGTLEEYELAKQMKKKIIPIGVTGYSAKQILDDVKSNLILYPYLEKYIEILETEDNVDALASVVIAILNEVTSFQEDLI